MISSNIVLVGKVEVRTRLEPGWFILVEVTKTVIGLLGFGLKENVRCHLFVHFLLLSSELSKKSHRL